MTNTDLYARAASALGITREHFAAWIDGDPFAGYDLAAVPGDALETLHARGIITADELRWFESDETPAAMAAPVAAAMAAPVAAELARLSELPRTEFVGRVLALDITPHSVTVDDQHPDVNGTSMDIYNGLTRSVGLRDSLTPDACAEFVRDNADLIARVARGLSSEWDGSNMRGVLTDDAAQAEEELTAAAEVLTLDMYAWERGDVLEEMVPGEYLRDVRDQIEAQPDADAAAAFALDCIGADGVCSYGEGAVWVDRDAAEQTAREWWEEGQPEE